MGKTFRRQKSFWDDDLNYIRKSKKPKKRKTLREFRKKRQEKIEEKSFHTRER